jgi:hypothetical protein
MPEAAKTVAAYEFVGGAVRRVGLGDLREGIRKMGNPLFSGSAQPNTPLRGALMYCGRRDDVAILLVDRSGDIRGNASTWRLGDAVELLLSCNVAKFKRQNRCTAGELAQTCVIMAQPQLLQH